MGEFVWSAKYSIGNAEMNAIMKHSGNLDVLVYKFKRLMNAWVLEHILTEDSRIAPPKKPEDPADSPAGTAQKE